MIVHKTALDGVLQITPPTRFEDWRGEYVELYNEAQSRKMLRVEKMHVNAIKLCMPYHR